MFHRLFNPEVFQGNLNSKNYFEGWYFKHVSHDLLHTYSFIPGISLAEDDPHAFIQIMNGSTGETEYVRYSVDEFHWEGKRLYLKVGSSEFSEEQINLNIKGTNFNLSGKISYSNNVRYPKTILSPGIMGWYSFIPFMECKHGIVSVNHDLSGSLSVNGNNIDFENGKGYIEKDWGVSFPEAWIWIQSNNFNKHETSFCFSLAKIPWLGKFFIGFISFLYFDNKFYLFSTYNKSLLSEIYQDKNEIGMTVINRYNILKIRVVRNSFGDLIAPVSGSMTRRIQESIDSEVHIQLFDKQNNLKYSDSGKRVGLEVIEKIFSYIK